MPQAGAYSIIQSFAGREAIKNIQQTQKVHGMDPINLHDYEALAKERLKPEVWDFIDGAYGDEVTKRRNRAALDEVTVNPNFLVDVGERDLTTTVLGEETSFPVMISPAGGQMIAHPDGELAAARAANAAGTVYALASASGYGMEEVSKAAQGPLWFQFYHYSDEVTEYLLPIAKACGYSAICLTIDTPISAPKDRDIRNNYTPGPESRWGSLARRPELAKLRDVGVPDTISWDPPGYTGLTWERLDYVRSLTGLPLVLKGVRTVADAKLCVKHGVDGIIVSNHGGRQLDGTLSSIETLPGIAEAVGDKLEVYIDSGIRRGVDVLRALALGARAVMIGRPVFWGLAVDGEAGVRRLLELLRIEFDRAMAYCGISSVDQIQRSHVSVPGEWYTRV